MLSRTAVSRSSVVFPICWSDKVAHNGCCFACVPLQEVLVMFPLNACTSVSVIVGVYPRECGCQAATTSKTKRGEKRREKLPSITCPVKSRRYALRESGWRGWSSMPIKGSPRSPGVRSPYQSGPLQFKLACTPVRTGNDIVAGLVPASHLSGPWVGRCSSANPCLTPKAVAHSAKKGPGRPSSNIFYQVLSMSASIQQITDIVNVFITSEYYTSLIISLMIM